MFVITLDPRRTHEGNPDCPMRLTLSPDGQRWMCADCGMAILWTKLFIEGEGERRADYIERLEECGAMLKACHGRPPIRVPDGEEGNRG